MSNQIILCSKYLFNVFILCKSAQNFCAQVFRHATAVNLATIAVKSHFCIMFSSKVTLDSNDREVYASIKSFATYVIRGVLLQLTLADAYPLNMALCIITL